MHNSRGICVQKQYEASARFVTKNVQKLEKGKNRLLATAGRLPVRLLSFLTGTRTAARFVLAAHSVTKSHTARVARWRVVRRDASRGAPARLLS